MHKNRQTHVSRKKGMNCPKKATPINGKDTKMSAKMKTILDLTDLCVERIFENLPLKDLFEIDKVGIPLWTVARSTVIKRRRTLVVFDSRKDVEEHDNYINLNYNILHHPATDPEIRYRKIFHSILKDKEVSKRYRPNFCIMSDLVLLKPFINLTKLVLFRVKNISTATLKSTLSRMPKLEFLVIMDLNSNYERLPQILGDPATFYQKWYILSITQVGEKINWESIWPVIDSLKHLRHLVLSGVRDHEGINLSPRLIAQLHQFVISVYKDKHDSLLKIFKRFSPFFTQLAMINVDDAEATLRWLSGNTPQATRLKAQLTELTIECELYYAYDMNYLDFVCNSFSSLTYLNFSLKEFDFGTLFHKLSQLTSLNELRLAIFLTPESDDVIRNISNDALPKLTSVKVLSLKTTFTLNIIVHLATIFPNIIVLGIERCRIKCKCGIPQLLIDIGYLECPNCLRLLHQVFKRFKHLPSLERA